MRNKKRAGFTLIELMIVVAIIAIIASIAIPRLMSARLSANESAAISTLRSIASSQAQFQSAAAVDVDSDGGGEYGFMNELAGHKELRIDDGSGKAKAGSDKLNPSVLSSAFGNDLNTIARSGYVFQILLPDANGKGVGEAATGGLNTNELPDPDQNEIAWVCYAWPADYGNTGNRAFVINQEGDLLQTNNRTKKYSGTGTAPANDAAFTTENDTTSALAIGTAGKDGQTWTAVQ